MNKVKLISIRVLLLVACLFYSNAIIAYDFEVNGLCYNILSSNEVEVTYRELKKPCYSGELSIPNIVTYGGKTYSVTSIGEKAFSDCTALIGTLTIPNSVTSIGGGAFAGCGFTGSLIIPNSVKTIGPAAFWGCSGFTGSLIIPNSVTTIDTQSFYGCSGLTGSLTIPNSVTRIGYKAFEGCIFSGSLIIPNSVTTIEGYAFYGCSGFTGSLIIPNSVTTIEEYAFYGCSGFTNLMLPCSVTLIGGSAFQYCKRLSYVESQMETPFTFGSDVFLGIASNAILVIPKGESYPYGITKWFAEIRWTSASYILSISTSGNGYASYNGTSIRNKTTDFSLNEGTSAAITFTPDNGYRIKSVKVNNTTVSVSNNQYTISSIKANTTVSVEFEAVPVTTYTLSITASGNGSVFYGSTSIRSKTSSFTVNEGSSVTISFAPDDGCQIKSVKVNGSIVSVTSNQYTISNISGNKSVVVEFEVIPQTTSIVSIKASGNGSVSYDGETIRNETKNYTVNIGTSITVYFHADEGYRLKSLKVNNMSLSGKQYCTTTINRNTTIEVEYEAIPTTSYTLSITSIGNGSISYNSITIRNKTSTFAVNEGSSAKILFTPDDGYQINAVKVNGSTVSVSNNEYMVSGINENTTVEVEFVEQLNSFEYEGVNYNIVSRTDRIVYVAAGDYGKVLEVPWLVNYQDMGWLVDGVENGAFDNNPDLAAIIWHPDTTFNGQVSNPNLLLYVQKEHFAPDNIKNVVVNGIANKITLTDVASGNNFYCPQEFTAKTISYTHHYKMETGLGNARGWETIALPFDVQKITHQSKGEIIPFSNWKSGDAKKPFWLMTYGTEGWTEANSVKANTPYIISMPNHDYYRPEFRLSGNVTFSAENVKIPTSENLYTSNYNGRTFVPNYTNQSDNSIYALNVNNDFVSYGGSDVEGSIFFIGLRVVHPFEAYMTSASQTRSYIAIVDDMTTGIGDITEIMVDEKIVRVYNLNGQLIMAEENKSVDEIKALLSAGVYIVNGKKLIIK